MMKSSILEIYSTSPQVGAKKIHLAKLAKT